MDQFHLSTPDVIIILAAIVGVISVGLWTSRRMERTSKGYFLASGRMRWYIIGAAFVSTSVSSEQIVGTVGRAYENGMGVGNWEWWSLPVYTLVMVFFIPIYLKNRIMTIPEFLSKRYGPLCGDIYSWVMLVAYIFVFLVPVLYGGSLAIHRLTGWNFHAILWITATVVALYAIKGGLGSIMWTDALQCLMLVGGGLILFFIALDKIPGGWSAMETASPQRYHLYRPLDDPIAPFAGLICGSVGAFLFYQSTNQVMIQRILAARSTWDGLMGITFAGFIGLIRPLVTCFLGFIVYHWIYVMEQAPPLENLDHTFPFALTTFAPQWGLRGIVLAGFLAAVMSTTSALANATATIFSLDVYKKVINKDADDNRLIWVGRVAAGTALILACLCAPFVEKLGGIYHYYQKGVTYVTTPFVSVLLLGILWKRTNYTGALFGLIGGVAIQAVLAITFPLLTKFGVIGIELHWFYVAFIAQVIIMTGVVIVSLKTQPPEAAQWQPFHWNFSVLANYDSGTVRPWYLSVKLWFGLYAVIWLYLYWRFW